MHFTFQQKYEIVEGYVRKIIERAEEMKGQVEDAMSR